MAIDALKWVILGLIAGGLARFIMPGRQGAGCVVTILLGIAGALLAGYFGRVAGFYDAGEHAGLIAATLGAVAVLAMFRVLAGRK
jgi:uncharacterized membrane protein YeaQ/YmgE (transglycosylase-associated protein family)